MENEITSLKEQIKEEVIEELANAAFYVYAGILLGPWLGFGIYYIMDLIFF